MLVVNLLRSGDGLVLTIISTPPEKVREKKAELVQLLQDQTNLAISVDRIEKEQLLQSVPQGILVRLIQELEVEHVNNLH